MGRKSADSAKIFIEETGIPMTWEEYLRDREEILARLFPHATLLPGVSRLVSHLKSHGIPIGVATSSHSRHFQLKSGGDNAPFFAQFDVIVRGDDPDVKHGKPLPDIFLVARGRFEGAVPPCERVLVFEDAPNGVEAAVAAGMPVVMIPDKNVPAAQTVGATQVIMSMEDFVPEEWGLPPFKA